MPSARTYISSLKQILTTDLSGQGIDGQLVEQAWLVLFDILKHEDLNLLSTPQLERLLEQRVIPTASTAIDPETSPRKLLIRFVRTHSLHQRDVLLDGYVLALKARGCSKATIRNYLSDIRQFFSISDEKHVESLLTETVLQKFVAQQENAGLATSSIRRKLTTAAQFAKWLRSEEVIDSATADSMYRLSQVYAKPEAEAYIAKPIEILPVVAVSSIEKQPLTEPVMAHAGRPIVSIEKDKSEPIGVVIPPSSVKRPRSGIRLFLPKFGIQGAVTSLALLLSVLGLSLLVRMQFLQNVDRSMAFPTVLTRPTRSLSFQGRLTDSAQNPITNATNMNFKLYTTGPSTTGGTILWNSGNCSVNPDQDGIFSTGLGSDCGAEIDANVFSENTSVWLQITVGTSPNDEVLSPRQSIKSVAYALNSETLQGYPASASAVENTVLVMNNAGEVVLANASPKIKSTGTSGLNIEGASLTLQTTGNGNVNLSPAGLGNIVASRYIYAPGATLSATYAGGDALTLVGNASSSGELTFIGATDPKINILNGENFGIRTSVGGLAGLAERLTVLNNGFVGVGTPTPGYRFDVVSGTAIAARFDGRVIGVNAVNSNELVTKSQLDAVGSALPPATTNGQTLRANGTSWVANSVLFNDGTNVGIGTTAPIANLDIQGSGTTMGSLRVRGNYTNDTDTNSRSHAKLTLTPNWNSGDYPFTIEASAFGPLKFTQSYWNGSAVVQRDVMQIDGSGFVGIGTTVPGARLEVAGQVKITGGSPGAGKVLTSDSVGLATWESPGSVVSAAQNISLVTTGGTIVTGNTVTNTGPSGNWDKQAYSKDGYDKGAYVSAVVDTLGQSTMFGLNADPTTDASYCSIDFAWYITSSTNGYIYESCGNPQSGITIAVGDVLAVTYDGVNVKYLQNGVVRRTVPVTITTPLYFDSSFANSNLATSISRIQIGAMSPDNYVNIGGDTMTGPLDISTGTTRPLRLTTSSSGPWAISLYRSDIANEVQAFNNAGSWYFSGGSLQHNGATIWDSANDGAGTGLDADLLDGQSGAYYSAFANLTGIPTRTAWSGVHRGFVAEQLSWKNYGNGHTIFDASAGTSPDGTAVNSTNSQYAWTSSYPTLMGWNGGQTYGVRVDSARVADSASGFSHGGTTNYVAKFTGTTSLGNSSIFDNGNVGIGTTGPGNKLSVYGGRVEVDNVFAGQSAIQISSAGVEKAVLYRPANSVDVRMYGTTAGNDIMTWDTTNARVGIGTTAPISKLDFGTSVANQKLIIGTYVTGNFWSGIGMDGSNAGIRIAGDSTGINQVADFGYYSNDSSHNWTSQMSIRGGNVGIGTTAPLYPLHVEKSKAGDALVRFENTNATGDGLYLQVADDAYNAFRIFNASDSQAFVVKGSGNVTTAGTLTVSGTGNSSFTGNVGIGTTGPNHQLSVYRSAGTATTAISGGNSDVEPFLASYSGSTSWGSAINGFAYFYSGVDGDMDLYRKSGSSTASHVMTITRGAGLVGIGTTSPGYRLDVVSGSAIAARFDGRVIGVNAVNSNELVTKSQLDLVGSALPPATTNGQTLRANGTSWVANSVLFNDGTNVGIGTTGPVNTLQIGSVGSSGFSGNSIAIGNGTQVMAFYLNTTAATWYTNTNFALMPAGTGATGNVGIGTTSPVDKLDVRGNIVMDRGRTISFGGRPAIDTGEYISESPTGTLNFYAGSQLKIKMPNDGTTLQLMPNGGNVGIGITSPIAKLDTSYSGPSSATTPGPMFYLNGSGGLPQFPRTVQNASASITTNDATVATGAVIGLNMENISSTDGTYSPFLSFSRKSASGGYNDVFASIGGYAVGTGPDTNWVQGDIVFHTQYLTYGPLERMRILANGNVGIGTTAPGYKLEVSPNLTTTLNPNSFSGNNLMVRSGSGTATIGATYIPDWAKIGASFVSSYVGQNYTNIGSFSFGEGTGSAQGAIGGLFGANDTSTGTAYGIYIKGVTSTSGSTYGIYQAGGSKNYFAGNVGIGTTGPTEKLDISGNLRFSGALMPNNLPGSSGQFLISSGAGVAPTWTSNVPATSLPFSGITSGTNTQAAMVVGTGASLNYSGSGTINASSLIGGTWAIPGTIGSTTPNTGAFTTLSADGNITQYTSHGNNMKLWLSAGRNGGGTGEVGLYSWISEPGVSWTGGGIARNMYNTTSFPRINTGLSGQMMRFAEGNTIEFTIETAAGARTNPLTITTGGLSTGTITSGLINDQTISSAANFTGTINHAFNNWAYAGGYKAYKELWSAYSGSSYPVLQIGETASNHERIAIGVDLSANASGNFNGDEVIFPQGRSIMTPNAANNGYIGIFGVSSGNKIFLGNYTAPYATEASGILTIDTPNGFIGIGSTSPAYKLDVANGTGIVGQFSGRVIGGNAVNNNEFVTYGQLSGGGGPWTRTAPYVYLTTGTDNVGIGTTVPDSKLDVSGPTANTNTAFNHYQNLASYGGVVNDTGTKKITLPLGWTNTMMTITIKGYDYSNAGSWEVIVSGYNYAPSTAWINTSAEVRGKAPFSSVRLGYDGSKMVVLLGTTSTVWQYPKIKVSDFYTGHSNLTGWGSGWTITNITSEAGIVNINSPMPPIYTDSNGNVGIGTTGPGEKLHVYGSQPRIKVEGSGASDALFTAKTTSGSWDIGQGRGTTAHEFSIFDVTNSRKALSIDSSGNVNIGGGLSGRRLDVYNSANNGDGLAIGQDTDNSQSIQAYIDGQWTNRVTYASGCCNLLKLQPDVGAVQIGSATNPTSALSVFGAATFSSTINATGAITASQFNGSGAGLTGTGASFTSGSTNFVISNDGDRNAATKLPITSAKGVRFDFVGAGSAGTGGNYAGVMTYAPWDGTTASTGDASYQLAFGSTAANGGGVPKLNIRKGIDSTWNSWYTLWHDGNDGSGSGLDADLLDGHDSSYFATSTSGAGWTDDGAVVRLTTSTDSVGIGTATVTGGKKLEVSGNIRVGDVAVTGNELHFNDDYNGDIVGYINYYGYATGLAQFRDLSISNGKGGNVLYVDGSTSNVGIGTTGPGWKLDVSGSVHIPDANTYYGASFSTNDYSTMNFNSRAWSTVQGANGKAFTFTTHTDAGSPGYEAMTINYGESGHIVLKPTGGGNVGIGTTGPNAKLHVYAGASNIDPTLTPHATAAWDLESAGLELVGGVATSSPYAYWIQSRNASGAAAYPISLNPLGGNVGIGTTVPGARLEVAGQVKITGGSPGAGKVLTSDSVGLATWESPGSVVSAAQNISLVTTGGTIVTGNTVTNTGPSGNWDKQAYSKDGYDKGAYVSAVVDTLGQSTMFGLNADPTTDASYCSIDFAWYITSSTNGYIYESCGNPQSGITIAVGDVLAVTYDGVNVKYLQNGVVRRTVPVTITTPLYFDSSFANSNLATSISRIQIGAMSPDNYVNIGGDTMTGSLDMSGNTYTTYGPNTSWGAYLRVGGNGRTVNGDSYASVVATDGNLHLDAGNAKAMYLNYYAGTGGIIFGNGATGTNANVSAAGAYTGTSLNVGSGAITSGLINGQTISSAANFTGSLTVAGETYLNGTVLEGDNKTMFRYSDSYLRLNEDNDFSNGIWFGPSNRLGGAGYMALGSNGGTTNSTLYLYGGDYTGTNLIKIDSSSGTATSYFNAGNVGIGTTAPQGQIQVKGADDVMTTSQDTPGGGTYMGGGNGCPWCGQWYTSYSPIPGAGVGDGGSSGGKAAGVYYGGYGDWVAGGGAGIYTQGGAGSLHGFGGVGIYAKGGVHGANVGNGVAPAIYADGPMVTSGGLVVGSAYATSARNANSSYGMAVADGNAYISGSVGIGTTNPLAPLMVGSGASGNNRLSGGSYSEYWITESYPRVFLSRDGGGSGVSALQFGIGSSPVDTTIQRLPSGAGLALMGGNVGIGTTNPQAKLEIAGSTSTNYPIYGKGDTGAKVFYNVANYNYDGGNQTGYAIIQTNIPQDDHTMISVDVDVYGLYYDGSSNNCRLVISGYWSSESNGGFMGLGQTNVCGTKYNVQMARNTGTGKAAIIIGSVGTTWSHPKIYVPKMEAGYGIADSYADSWSIQVTTDISGFSNNDNVPDTTSVAAASSVAYANITGLPTRTAWSGVHRGFVAEQLSWKNYGNSHTIFDASQSTSPDGGAVNNTNAQVPWSATYPTLMGWNGGATYGVRVDSARVSDYSSSTNDIFVNTTGDTMSGNLTFDNYGIGVVGTYSDVRYQNIFSMGPTYRMMADGTALTGGPGGANFYGVAYTHSNMGGQSKAGLGHQALFVTNGSTQTAIGTGIWTSGNVNIGGGLSDRRLDVYNSANNGDGLAIGQDTDNSQTIQAYIDNQWTNRVSYASGCCNLLKLQPDVGAVQIGSATNPTSALSVFGAATFSSTINATGAITASQFNGSGAGLTGTAASLTAGAVPWSGITSKPAYLFYYQGFTLDANTMASNVSGFTYSNNAPHTGPIASFSEPGYPLQLNASYGGGGDAFSFRTRNGDNGTWNGWNTILHSDNYNSYSPTLTGGGASGTWGINITGNAATATYSSSTNDIFVNTSGDTMTGALTTPSLSFTGVGGNSGQPAAGSDYRIYQEPGTWSYPYPDLNIAYHTGIKIGAHSSYGGTRFFNNSDMVTELMSVGNGDNHVRISNQLLVTGNVGIGSATANGTLQLHSTSASTDRRIMFTDGTTGSAASDGLVLVKATDQNGYLWNYENNSLIFGTNNTERINIAAGGTIDLKSDTKTRNLNVGVWSGSSNGFPNADSRFNIGSSTQWYTYSYVYRAYSKNGLIQGFDLAEGMPYEGDLEAGDIVVAHATKKETVIGSSKSYQETVMGVVSTAPGITLGTNWSADSIAKYGDIPMKPIALAGRVPVKVTLEGGTITQNDKITSSSTAKFGMKSTKVGNVVAVAMESFAPNTSICSAVPSVSAIVWPADEDGHNSAKPCFYTPDGKYYGKIMAIINVSWYDPDAYLSSTDGTVITGQSQNYAVTPVGSNSPITRISLLAEAVIGKIKAGLVTTQDLVVTNTASISSLTVNSLQVGGSSLQAYIESVVNNMQLNNSTSLPPGSVVTDNITATGSATINKTVTNTLNVTSTATIAGSLKAQTIETNDLKANTSKLGNLLSDTATFGTATISGSTSGNEPILDVRGSARITALEAKMANVENIRALTATLYDATVSGTLYANTIAGLDEKVAAGLQPTLLQQLIGYDPAATDSARIISQITGVDLSTTIVLDPAALDSLPTDKVLLGANAAFLEQYLQVNGNTALGGDLMIVGSINMTNGLSLHDNSISYTPVLPASCELDHSSPQCSTTLRIQPSGAGALDLMNGLALLENGTVTITGDVTFTKKVIVRDTLLADLLAPTSFDKPIQIKVAGVATESGELVQSRFEIINELDSPVATISAQGKADFSGGISVGRTDLLTPDASGSATVTKTSGKAAIPVGSSQIRILSDRITPDTLIYVTAQGDTQNQNLYIKNQIVGEAVIGFNNPLPTELVFNWWIVE